MIKHCIIEFYSNQSPGRIQQIHEFLINWEGSDTIVQDCFQLLTKETEEPILFYAARSLRDFLRYKTRENYEEQQIIEIGNFVSELVLHCISTVNSEQDSEFSEETKKMDLSSLFNLNSFKFFLYCIADSCAFSRGAFLLKDACSKFPIDVSLHICTAFYEDWNLQINTKWDVKGEDIEFTLNVLREVSVSVEWIFLYSFFSEYVLDVDILSEFFPQLHEALKLTDSYCFLVDHIETILSLMFNPYSMIIIQFSLEFSKYLRELIEDCLEKNDIDSLKDYNNNLTLLWSHLIKFQDETETFFKDDIFVDFLKEFSIVETVLITTVQKTEDVELWPTLIESMISFSEIFSGKESYQHYAVDFIEFILYAGSIGVDLTESDIPKSLFNFYIRNTEEIKNYLMNPTQSVSSILTFLSIIEKGIEKKEIEGEALEEEQKLPIEIPLAYLENIDVFLNPSSTKDVIYFSLTFVEPLGKNEKCVEKFCQLFCVHFEILPYECAEGFYKISKINKKIYYDFEIPQLLFENYETVSFFDESNNDQEQNNNWDGELILSKSPLIFMLPCIITDQIDLILNDPQYEKGDKESAAEMEERLMTQLNEIASYIFDNLMKSLKQSVQQFLIFLRVISSTFVYIKTNDEKSLKNDIIKRFCSLIFQQIMQISQHLWLDQSKYIQNYLAYFVKSAFNGDFVGDFDKAIVSWLDQVINVAPVDLHFEIPRYLYQYFKDMTNLQAIIQNCIITPEDSTEADQNSISINEDLIKFAMICLKSLNHFQKWDDSFFILFPPQLLLALAAKIEDKEIFTIFRALGTIIDSEKADSDLIGNLLLITLNEYKRNNKNEANLRMIKKIFILIGEENVVQACESLEFDEASVKQLLETLSQPS